ncbi:hypothetical protein ADK67_44140 [Saccharothrix sp. NRRL B-16348]|nr:hypothetical protein ADK67_44140 [Saccharothrix sp. NRRL B-16348]
MAVSAVRWVLDRACAAVTRVDVDPGEVADTGAVLLRIVEAGHGAFPGGELSQAHAHMLLGLGTHLSTPATAARSYEQAARLCDSHGSQKRAALARLAATAANWEVLSGGDPKPLLDALDTLDQGTAAVLRPAVEGYLAAAREVRAVENGDVPSRQDAETAVLLSLVAYTRLDDHGAATRLARAADAIDPARRTLEGIGDAYLRRRQWPQALDALAECLEREPGNRALRYNLGRVHIELDEWDEAKAVLLAVVSDPPVAEDAGILQLLHFAAFGRHDPDYERWGAALNGIESGRDILAQIPFSSAEPPPERLRAVYRDGELMFDTSIGELAAGDIQVHMVAAMVKGSPKGDEALDEVFAKDPELGHRVVRLLGLRRVTEDEARVARHMNEGEEHFRARRFTEAERAYRAALEIDPDHHVARLYLGDTWYRRGAYALAQAHFEESIAISPSPQAYRFLGDATLAAGGSELRARRCYEEALRLDADYGGARSALERMGKSDIESGSALLWEGPLHRRTASVVFEEQPSEATVEGASATPSERPSGDTTARAPATRRVRHGDSFLRAIVANRPDSVLSVVDDDAAFERWIAESWPSRIAAATIEVWSAAYHYSAKDRDLGYWAHLVRRCVRLAEALPVDFGPADGLMGLGRDRLLGDACHEQGNVLESQGRLAEARSWYLRALELLDAESAARTRLGLVGESEFDRLWSSHHPTAVVLEDLARVCIQVGDVEDAARRLERARVLQGSRPTGESWIEHLVEFGDRTAREGDTDRALAALYQAVDEAEEHIHRQVVPRAMARAMNALGRLHRSLGLHRSARAYLDRVRQLNEAIGNAVRLTYDFRELGRLFRLRPDLGDAEDAFERSLMNSSLPTPVADELSWTATDGTLHRVTAPSRAWQTLLDLADLLEDRGEPAKAAAQLELATRIGEVVRAAAVGDAQRVAVAAQHATAAAALTRVHLRRALDAEPDAAHDAWLASETLRARSFLDALGDDPLSAPEGVDPDLMSREDQALSDRRRLLGSTPNGVAFWDQLRRVDARLDAIWTELLDRHPSTAEYVEVRRSRPLAAQDLRRLVEQDGRPTVVANLNPVGPGELAVVAVRSDHDQPLVASRPVDVARLNRFLSENLGSAGRVRELALDLEDLWHHETQAVGELLAEVADPDDVLVVSPFEALNYVPFAALRAGGAPLVERNPLAVLPSGSLVRALRAATRTTADTAACVFGDPTGDLPGARAEAALVGGLLGASPVVGPVVTRAEVTRALRTAGIVHIAGHARFDVADPLSSALLLADGPLPARTVLGLFSPALSLVTLSACETGVNLTNAAQELLGLTRAFVFAGADSLLVSLWKVPDGTTVDVMTAFYRALGAGSWKVDALRAATLAARERYGEHRFDQWSGFHLIGEWQ